MRDDVDVQLRCAPAPPEVEHNDAGRGRICNFRTLRGRTEYPRYLRGLVPLGLFLDQLSLGVDGEYPAEWNAHLLIGEHILHGEKKG